MRPKTWRVRVKRAVDLWVDVTATSAIHAEGEAAKLMGVMQVYARSALPADEADAPEPKIGVEE